MTELASCHSDNRGFASEALIECLIKHRELIRGPHIWSPAQSGYVRPDHRHGTFTSLRARGPVCVRFTDKLLPLYCKISIILYYNNMDMTLNYLIKYERKSWMNSCYISLIYLDHLHEGSGEIRGRERGRKFDLR